MKIRSDFVSNSSSSSFIIHDNIQFFKSYDISCEMIYNALVDIMQIIDPPPYEANIVYPLYCGRKVVVYDMTNPLIKRQIYAEYDYMRQWIPRQQSGWECWDALETCLNRAGIDNYSGRYTVESGSLKKPMEVPGAEQFVSFIKAYMEVYNMYDFLKMDDTTHLIHFGDNDISSLAGWSEVPKTKFLSRFEKDDPKDLKDSRTSQWESPTHSDERFWDILLHYLAEKYKLDYNTNDIIRKNMMERAHWIKPDSNIDWDMVQSFIDWEAVLHEG